METAVDLTTIPTLEEDPGFEHFFHTTADTADGFSRYPIDDFLEMALVSPLWNKFGGIVETELDFATCPEFHRTARECLHDLDDEEQDRDKTLTELAASLPGRY